MNKSYINATKLFVAAGLAFTLAACGSKEPSESEAKAVIKDAISDCSYLSLESFSKTNGIPVDDNNYRVEVKYTLKLKPDSDSKDMLEKWDDVAKQYRSAQADYQQVAAAADKANLARDEELEHPTTPMTADQIREATAQRAPDPSVQAAVEKMGALQGQMTSLGGPAAFGNTVRAACPKVSPQLIGRFFRNDVSLDDLESGVSMEFTDTFQMQRSDNGWIAAQ